MQQTTLDLWGLPDVSHKGHFPDSFLIIRSLFLQDSTSKYFFDPCAKRVNSDCPCCGLMQGETPEEVAGLATALKAKMTTVQTAHDGDKPLKNAFADLAKYFA